MQNYEQAIYEPGETHLQTTVTNGFVDFSDGLTVSQYLEKHKGRNFVVLPFIDAVDLAEKAIDDKYIGAWKEITEDEWEYALNVLPPQKWQTVSGVNIFRMCEFLTSNVTAHYAKIGNRYFTANRRTSTDYERLATEVFNATVEIKTFTD